MFKIGDYVTRSKYNNDILFKIIDIKDDIVILHGVDIRLIADSKIDDLKLSTYSKKKEKIINERNLDIDNYFYIPGSILHFDSDKDYLEKSIEYYKSNKLKFYGYSFKEKEYSKYIIDKIKMHNPDIVVLTGHDAYNNKIKKYKNSSYFIDTVKKIRKEYNGLNSLIIIAGACQSDYEGLLKSGSTFASSPARINVHALDPAIIATEVALSDNEKQIDIKKILSKTKYKSKGFGGIIVNGKLYKGFPRKEKI